jgi:hypothetical protein
MEYLKNLFDVENRIAVLTGGGGVLASEMAQGFFERRGKSYIT